MYMYIHISMVLNSKYTLSYHAFCRTFLTNICLMVMMGFALN